MERNKGHYSGTVKAQVPVKYVHQLPAGVIDAIGTAEVPTMQLEHSIHNANREIDGVPTLRERGNALEDVLGGGAAEVPPPSCCRNDGEPCS